ncbi:MAG: hypothetical protein COA99_05040 [Moraxellaceae bacterium]|nr:MAG: hypothetical protein COA99_05040 [Moraxellaceae bacterium]
MVDTQASVEAIYFFEDTGVCKEMMYTEFEAILDGVVGLNDFAGDTIKAAYVAINGVHQIESCVLFTIPFDRQGNASTSWNLPLRHLAETAGSGPNLGAGPIRLSCKSQCSVAWHHAEMWDPDMSSGNNTFIKIRDAAKANKLCLPTSRNAPGPAPAPMLADAQQSNWGVADSSPEASGSFGSFGSFGVETTLPPGSLSPSSSPGSSSPASSGVVPPVLNTDVSGNSFGLMDSQINALESEHSSKISSLLKAQHFHIKSLQTESQQNMAAFKLDYDKRLQKEEGEVSRLKSQHQSLYGQNMALREQNEAQRKQLDALKKAKTLESRQAEASKQEQLDELKSQYQKMLEERVTEESAKLKEEIELRNMELMHRHEIAKQLREELTDLRKDKLRMVQGGGDKFLERLEALGVSFIAFHPGAGHISIPLSGMPEYMDNPIKYAADKCLVSIEHYNIWLQHYEKPVCNQSLATNKTCDCKVARVDVPSQYVIAESDRCDKHKRLQGIGNIVSIGAINK